MFRFHIIFLTWSDMWRTWRHDTSTLSSTLQWHYMASRAPLKTPRASNYNQRPYNYISAANDNSGENKKGAERCTLDEKCPMISIAWPLRDIGHLPLLCTCLQITQILDKGDKVTLTLIQILDLKSSGARRSHSVSIEWNLFFSFSVTSSSKQESFVVLTLTKVTKIVMLRGVIINCCCYCRRWQ